MGEITESATTILGVDTSRLVLPADKRTLYPSKAVNRSFQRRANETRPGFQSNKLVFASDSEEYTFKNGAVTGAFFYKGSQPSFSPALIVAVGDSLFHGTVRPGSISFKRIYKGLDPQWQKTYFCQCLNILVIQNGVEAVRFWTGNINDPVRYANESKYQKSTEPAYVPPFIGTSMLYAHNRLFIATEYDLVYASDYINANGSSIEARESVLSFSETTYPSSGDGFGAPSDLGSITGMFVTKKASDVNGHGDIFVMCRNGAFTISPGGVIRNKWTETDMQKTAFIGEGCVSDKSIVSHRNQPFYRTPKGIGSILANAATYSDQKFFYDISNPVVDYLSYDTGNPNIKFCCAASDGERMFFSVFHTKEEADIPIGGVHRFAGGIVSSVSVTENGESINSWEGMWTGPRVTDMVEYSLYGQTGVLFLSYDKDKQNRVYTLSKTPGFDYLDSGVRKTKSYFEFSSLFFDDSRGSRLSDKTLSLVELALVESNGNVSVLYKTEYEKEYFSIPMQTFNLSGCGSASYHVSSMDSFKGKRKSNGMIPRIGYSFDIGVESEGNVAIVKSSFVCKVNTANPNKERKTCSNVTTRTVFDCFCQKKGYIKGYETFSYQF